jgi:SAM-dependent methyltransferase
MPGDQRLMRRATFGRVAASYTDARPGYPEQLLADLVRNCGLRPDTEVLEIGPGTGQLTIPLAELGCRLLAVELSDELANIARDRLAHRANVNIVVADFDSWPIPARAFDAVVAATSFHWLDPERRMRRCRSALKPGGVLAVIDTTWGVRVGADDRFFERSQVCYARWDPDHDPGNWHPTPGDVPTVREELATSGLFERVDHMRYVIARSYSRSQFVQLINTYSTVQSWPPERRAGFLQCMARLIDEEFGGVAERCDLYDVCVARARGDA